MRRDGPVQAEVEASVDAVMGGETPRELERPGRVGAFGPKLWGGAGLEQQGRSGNRGAHPAEAPSQIAPQVEHPEMEAGRRLDEHWRREGRGGGAGGGGGLPPSRGGAGRPPGAGGADAGGSAIAPRSPGRAPLFT